jgi:hypothetical protein
MSRGGKPDHYFSRSADIAAFRQRNYARRHPPGDAGCGNVPKEPARQPPSRAGSPLVIVVGAHLPYARDSNMPKSAAIPNTDRGA